MLKDNNIDDLENLNPEQNSQKKQQIIKMISGYNKPKSGEEKTKFFFDKLDNSDSDEYTYLFEQLREIYDNYQKYSTYNVFKNANFVLDIKSQTEFWESIGSLETSEQYGRKITKTIGNPIDNFIKLLEELFKIINIVKNKVNSFQNKISELKGQQSQIYYQANNQGFTFSIDKDDHICLSKFDIVRSSLDIYSSETQITPVYKLYKGNISDFSESIEYKLLFEYLFPLKRYVALSFITNVLCTQTRKQVVEVFNDTKAGLRKLSKIIQTNGQPLTPNPNNPQELKNDDPLSVVGSFLKQALLETPKMIAKGYIETTDPNVALSSGLYKIAKSFNENIDSSMIFFTGIPLAVAGTALPLSLLGPFGFNIYNSLYYGTFLWYEAPKKNTIDTFNIINNTICSDTKNPDQLNVDKDGYYITSNFTKSLYE